MTSVTVQLNPISQLTDEQFVEVCRANPEVKFEQTAQGELIIVAPTGGETGSYNSELNADFVVWNRRTQLGVVFDSSTCFVLPNNAKRSPDVSWIAKERWTALTLESLRKFPAIAPDFVLELLSPSDSLADAQAKMREYSDNGVRLGWLIDPETKQVEVYRQGQSVGTLSHPNTLSNEDVLPGFILNVDSIWK
ncbi:Uma2 family endonuclease [Phormidium sp. CLA17]|uniref:Uma2 family endonuclease n=1 Tax=Leptolyngbya sp. Cla-17 TaxID=2803751 RepID=UPI001490FFAC|nr:Uma2 family endonuclease [Leptolyngbya sp. Cla-17]MBM0740744.1 Uma2 family endonuclease [Leptolyngbya sp. Cla-17]